jgi:excinuclease ABC subunit B
MFKLESPFTPSGDQPHAIAAITRDFAEAKAKHHTLLGVTGSGKTFTMAHVIQNLSMPTLILAPNKTLAAQLFAEFKQLFPENAVEFFISYYDYFQPEAYVPSSDTYIAKDSSINDDIDKMRHAATRSLFERKDVIIVASVSCIYGLGSPSAYAEHMFLIREGDKITRSELLRKLVDVQYTRNDLELKRGCFRVRGQIIDILPSHQKTEGIRIELFDDLIDSITIVDALTGETMRSIDEVSFYPNSHYVSDRSDTGVIVQEILKDLGVRLRELKALGKQIEYQRLEQRVMADIEMLEELGYCTGIENYSRYLTGLPPGHPPPTLLDYFPEDFLIIIDESHLGIPQLRGMHRGDRARKMTLVEYGFRLPSALDNRPLSFDEFLQRSHQVLHVSATPGDFEREHGNISQQVIRPTGLLDPRIEVRPTIDQVENLFSEMRKVIEFKERVLITTLTKRMAEDLCSYYEKRGLKVRYLHSDIDSLERVDILRDLRKGVFDILIGINLLREGLDLPEVRLVAIMDADKEGFLRSTQSLIQTVGRAARNQHAYVIMYGDKVTDSMRECMDITNTRRSLQEAYNLKHNITPKSVSREIGVSIRELYGLQAQEEKIIVPDCKSSKELEALIRKKAKLMQKKAGQLLFEEAAQLRNEIQVLKTHLMTYGEL